MGKALYVKNRQVLNSAYDTMGTVTQFSKEPSFKSIDLVNSPIYELCMMVMVVGKNYEATVLGTCIVVCGPLVVTARHVAEAMISRFSKKNFDDRIEIDGEAWIVQIVGGEHLYAIWSVECMWICPFTDIAYMRLSPYNKAAVERKEWKQPILELMPPAVGSRVNGFGFNDAKTTVTRGLDGVYHIDVQSLPMATVGEVKRHYPEGAALCKFPCYETNFYNGHTMSGGAVFNDEGHLCGLISTGMNLGTEAYDSNDHTSFVCTLWPMLGTILHANRGSQYPRDIPYPALELARDGQINAYGWERVVIDNTGQGVHLL